MLPDKVLRANLDAIGTAARLDPDDDVLVSWLPLYHDMGLVGSSSPRPCPRARPWCWAPPDFTSRPARWMEWLSAYGGTAPPAPTSATCWPPGPRNWSERYDLSRLRIALNGAEPVDPDQVEAFVEAGARHGLRPGAVFCLRHGRSRHRRHLPEPGAGLVTDCVDRRVLETERYAAQVEPGPPAAAGWRCSAGPCPA